MAEVVVQRQQQVSKNKITTRPKSTGVVRNFSNPSYHSALDLAKAYSGMVNSHLVNSNFQNHVLKSAERNYNRQAKKESTKESPEKGSKIVRSKSSLLSRQSKHRSTIHIENNRIIRNPQDMDIAKSIALVDPSIEEEYKLDRQRQTQLREVLSRKTFRVPEYSQQLEQACTYKARLEKQIKSLKALINQQKKTKTKISLSCNKLMNQIQQTHKNVNTRQQQNYHLNTAILSTQKQNTTLQEQVNILMDKNKKILEAVNQEEKQCEVLRKYVEKTRMVVMGEERDVAKLKTMVTTSFNNMSNNYMNMNLLKSQKALLLADIDTQHARNK